MAPCSCLPHKLGQNSTDSKKRPNLNSFGFNYFEKRGRLPKPRPFMKRFRPAGLGGGGVPTNQPSFLTWSPFTQPPGSLNNTHVSTGPQERGKSGEPNLKSEKKKKAKSGISTQNWTSEWLNCCHYFLQSPTWALLSTRNLSSEFEGLHLPSGLVTALPTRLDPPSQSLQASASKLPRWIKLPMARLLKGKLSYRFLQ